MIDYFFHHSENYIRLAEAESDECARSFCNRAPGVMIGVSSNAGGGIDSIEDGINCLVNA